ncbi:MAG: DNA mismatch repair protein MutS [Alphaproteobacteria bacterium]|nr:DNA mismatch repair protein MutS [Alphaproteobacteria bacterium]
MFAQWHEAKAAYPDCLLFFRMGDFYELFFDDAVAAAEALDIALTKRGHQDGVPVPMAGVPVHAAEQYLPKLIKAGHRVAVCEQVEDPAAAKKRGAKSIVRREVVRVVTPGTLSEDVLLDARRHNYLAAIAVSGSELGLAWLDMSTGEVWLQPLGAREHAVLNLPAALARVAPGELLLPEPLVEEPGLFETWAELREVMTPLPASRFDSANAERRLTAYYGVATLESFGSPARAETAAAGALLDYLSLTQVDRMPRLARPHMLPPPGAAGGVMEIDPATRRNLELTQTLAGARAGSLLAVIDRTVTGAGARLLAERLAAPLTDIGAIVGRLDLISCLSEAPALRDDLRACLRECPDIERALSRLGLGRGGPRDLAAIRAGLFGAEVLAEHLAEHLSGSTAPAELAALRDGLGVHDVLVERLGRALAEALPLQTRDGGFIARGYSAALDEQSQLRDASRQTIAQLQSRIAEATGIAALKIKHNNVLGYFIEVTAVQADRLMEDGKEALAEQHGLIHRQTMANAMRFTTVELSDLEDRISRAGERALAIELELFDDLAGECLARADEIAKAARAMAALDVAAGLAELAVVRRYCRPNVSDSATFRVVDGRHPIVESVLDDGASAFVANDCDLSSDNEGDDGGRLWLLTGPNMAGKSTFLRQNALVAVLAQIGSFVPASEAEIGIVDRLFSRVGAADDLARGRSTFMVEMVETAAILNQASERSLVILDEIGRGTATFDGLSIAWATIEHLHNENRCRTLFATHFHELTSLAARLDQLVCRTMRVKEWQGDVVFLHEVVTGTADRSYGIHVARLAGLPTAVLARSEEVLALLERGDQGNALSRLADDLPLFHAAALSARDGADEGPDDPVRALLADTKPDELTPRTALELLYRLKAALDG